MTYQDISYILAICSASLATYYQISEKYEKVPFWIGIAILNVMAYKL